MRCHSLIFTGFGFGMAQIGSPLLRVRPAERAMLSISWQDFGPSPM